MPLDYKGFEEKYNLGVTFQQMFELHDKFKQLDGFNVKGSRKNANRNQYIKGFTYMLARKLENHTKLNELEKQVQLIPFKLPQFIRDYEEAVNNEFYKNNPNGKRHPYEGAQIQLLNIAVREAKAYNKPLPEIWAGHVKDGISLTAIRRFTSGTDEKSIDAAIIMHRAMRQVISERTWGWRLNPLNWNRLRKENAYMRELDAKVSPLDYGTRINPVLEKNQNPVLSTSATKEIIELRDAKTKELQAKIEAKNNAKIKSNEEKNKNDNVLNADNNKSLSTGDNVVNHDNRNELFKSAIKVDAIDNNASLSNDNNQIDKDTRASEYYDSVVGTDGFKEEMCIQIASYFKNFAPSLKESEIDEVVKDEIYGPMLEGAKQVCDAYDRCKDENAGEDAVEEHLERTTNNLYKTAYECLSSIVGEGDKKLVIAQMITDLFMNKVTPVAFNPKAYGDFGDNFSTRHDEFSINVIINTDFINKEKAQEMLDDAAKELRAFNKVNFTESDLISFSNGSNKKENSQMFIESNVKSNVMDIDEQQLNQNNKDGLIPNN